MKEDNKIDHTINTLQNSGAAPELACENTIKQAVLETLQSESVDTPCVVNVLITDDKTIRQYNRDYRGIDKATDVLSFPMQDFLQAGWSNRSDLELDEDTGELPLGDIVVSAETVGRQASEHGNTVAQEMVYMIIHSTLHLLGYDHDNESNKQTMWTKKEQILKEMDYNTNDN